MISGAIKILNYKWYRYKVATIPSGIDNANVQRVSKIYKIAVGIRVGEIGNFVSI